MEYSRRKLGVLLPALFAAAARQGQSAIATLPSKCYPYDSLPEKTNPQNHNETRQVFDGMTHKGVEIDMHITKLAPGQMPHPEHHHPHEEMVMLRNGSLEVTISGKTETIGAGSVAYVASNEPHHWKNPGSEPCEYFVLAVDQHNQ